MNDEKSLLNNIIRHLILHTSAMDDLGLLSGKMGVSLFFFRYSQHTGIKRYANFAEELLDEVYEEINSGIPKEFKSGLSGICWGMEYIIRNGFVNADADEILCDIDTLILEFNVRKVTDSSLETGLNGFAHYVLARCTDKPKLPIDTQYILELKCRMEEIKYCDQELTTKLDGLLKGENVDYRFSLIDNLVESCVYKKNKLLKKHDLGISKRGLTGIALRLINCTCK